MKTFSNIINESKHFESTKKVTLTLSNGIEFVGTFKATGATETLIEQSIKESLLNQTVVGVKIEKEFLEITENVTETSEKTSCNCVINPTCLKELEVCDKNAFIDVLQDEDCVEACFINNVGDICLELTDNTCCGYIEKLLTDFVNNETPIKLDLK
jgi:tryptophanase